MGPPPVIVLEQLADARRAGVSFADAFPDAVAEALAVVAPDERAGWRDALHGSVEGWRRGWDRVPPTRAEGALLLVAENGDRVPLPDRPCARCGALIEGRARNAIYCSERCKRSAGTDRDRITRVRAA
jgi:predicted nucleic acid-binding Zn ribbon protein